MAIATGRLLRRPSWEAIVNRRQFAAAGAYALAGCAHQTAPPPTDPPAQSTIIFAGGAPQANDALSANLRGALQHLRDVLARRFRRGARLEILGDPQTGRLDADAGRRVIDRVNASFGLNLSYEDGPYLLVLPRDPNAPAAPGDIALTASFAGQDADQVVRSINAISTASDTGRTDRLSWDAILAQLRETWAYYSPVQTRLGRANAQ